MQTKNETMGKL